VAIRAGVPASAANNAARASTLGGWRFASVPLFQNSFLDYGAIQLNQPSALSRPGNLGTAYVGVWTGDIKETF